MAIQESIPQSALIPQANDAEVVIIGAGPVGLWTSILMKALDPETKISVLDKYSDYKRDNPLQLNRSSFEGIPKDAKVQAIVDEIFTKDGKKVSSVKINTNRIEEILLKAANDFGVDVRRGPENEIKTLHDLDKFAKAKFIIGTDGAKSTVRNEAFGELARDEDLQYIAQAKYKTEALKPKPTDKLRAFSMMKVADAYVAENPRNPREGEKTGTMNLLVTVSAKTFKKIKDATFKAPFKLAECPKKLQAKIKLWMGGRKEQAEVEVSSIRLSSYCSKEFAKVESGHAVAVIGDAAFGVPYFRSLNNGIACAIKFAKEAHKEHAGKSSLQNAMKKYNSFVHKLADREMFRAKIKSYLVRALGVYINVIGWLPRQAKSSYESYLSSSANEAAPAA
jgi:2-polyprenyl-6-methoxyphenol hydroxylase-like FAD-dependent oxidoreductase